MTDFKLMQEQVRDLLKEEPWYVSAMSNISAVIISQMEDLNWAGFYLLREGRLVVGPFQGKPACIHIRPGKGVCGTCLEKDETIVVPDVHAFPGHIACDSASRSEIVVPVHHGAKIAAVLDIDSPVPDRFSKEDREGLEGLAAIMERWMEIM